MKVDRLLRINEMMQRELGDLIERRISPYVSALVTVVKVKISPDLQVADIIVSIYGKDEQREAVMEMLRTNRVAFQAELGRRIKIKFTPVLKFHLDVTGAKADRVLALIDELHLPIDPEPVAAEAVATGTEDAEATEIFTEAPVTPAAALQ